MKAIMSTTLIAFAIAAGFAASANASPNIEAERYYETLRQDGS